MAKPMTPSQRLAAFKAEGIKLVEMPGWRDRCRCHDGSHERGERPTGRPWGPVNGAMIHHTGSDTSNPRSYAAGVLTNGYAGLPGPLCTDATAPDGTLYLIASGRANHAGGGDADDAGDRNVLQSVIDEAAWLMQREAKPDDGNIGGSDGNDNFYGNEAMYSGGHAPTAAQLDTMVRWAAAICRFHGWSARSVIGHREWSKDKPDPGYVGMVDFRRRVQARLDTTPAPAPAPERPVEVAPPTSSTVLGGEIVDIRNEKLTRPQNTRIPAGQWTYLPIGPDGYWGGAQQYYITGEVAVTIPIPQDAYSRIRFFANGADGRRVHQWPDEGHARMHEVTRQISTVLQQGHRLGVEVLSSVATTVTSTLLELNITTAKES